MIGIVMKIYIVNNPMYFSMSCFVGIRVTKRNYLTYVCSYKYLTVFYLSQDTRIVVL